MAFTGADTACNLGATTQDGDTRASEQALRAGKPKTIKTGSPVRKAFWLRIAIHERVITTRVFCTVSRNEAVQDTLTCCHISIYGHISATGLNSGTYR